MKQYDFSGYATKHGIKCSDGRTIMHGAFKDATGSTVPLVWHHAGSAAIDNVVGKAKLEHRPDGVMAYGYLNNTPSGKKARELIAHGDITALSIYANQLVEKAGQVFHGVIREVSLVIAGANPGAKIEDVAFAHDADDELYEVVITSGEPIMIHADEDSDQRDGEDASEPDEEKTLQEIYDTLTEEQKAAVAMIIEQALADDNDGPSEQPTGDEKQEEMGQSTTMGRTNVFEKQDNKTGTLSHADAASIVASAQKIGSLRSAVEDYALSHGIENLELLFPDAKTVDAEPSMISRKMEWVSSVVNAARHSPFSKVKSLAADITADEARAKGYIKGNLKKEEVITLLKRSTGPTTIYKKQKLDRDDIIDITDFDVVGWLKAEMRVMLEEELAVAILFGDGRAVDDEDKINEACIRPIANDHDMYSVHVSVPTAMASGQNLIDQILQSRPLYKGSGSPVFFTSEQVLTTLLLLKDKLGRRIYATEAELASALRVSKVIPVEAMDRRPDLLGIMVNMSDYVIGANRGGAVSLFDDFDIDYNTYKYLIETRVSGALVKPFSALVFTRTAAVMVTPVAPGFDPSTNTITIPVVDGVNYFKVNPLTSNTPVSGDIVITEETVVEAIAAPGFVLDSGVTNQWTYAPVTTP